MPRQFLVKRHASDRARTLARVGHWLLPWICILILSSTIAHATELALTESTSATTGAACEPQLDNGVPEVGLNVAHTSADRLSTDVAYVHVK
jgi:hypothetical protein